ncbi:MAG: cyanophycinase [Elusimicrobia bacterium GWA2_61_42]|nr:MAG: cyanophycinase [Elusimicrobia bacterium GWA2_61_42]OGR80460.1 MAG: cyanophycinase [Elusimicrobia bacterium GWC2_61_25]
MSRFIELAGGRNAPLAVIPLASGDPADAAKTQVDQLKRLGAADAEGVIFAKGEADKEENLRKIRRARGVFFTGGDQVTLVSFLAGTKMLEEIHRVYREGGVVGGTSAGAAIMSRVMLTGDDRQAKKDEESFSAIRSSAVAIAEGFGFVPENIVMDQHFLVRKRQNRLISVVLENPGLTGIGVDEATAFIVGPGGEAEVLGASLVTVFETMGAGPVTKDEPGHLAAKGITMHLLKSGDRYTLPKAAKIK